jgi:cysteine-S-conjugate beta-lyase
VPRQCVPTKLPHQDPGIGLRTRNGLGPGPAIGRAERGGTQYAHVMSEHAASHPWDNVTEEALRKRKSAKWSVYGPAVLPLWVAEMDFPVAEPIHAVLRSAMEAEDFGYPDPKGLPMAFAEWAKKEWGLDLAEGQVRVAPDVVTAIGELVEVVSERGSSVVIDTPVYAPFAATIRERGRNVLRVPLLARQTSHEGLWEQHAYRLDLGGIEAAYKGGARLHLLCSPHNPTGVVYPSADLADLAQLAKAYGVTVVSDEIHAPLTLPGSKHIPFPLVSDAAREVSILLSSASKTWNIAGLKAHGKAPERVLVPRGASWRARIRSCFCAM